MSHQPSTADQLKEKLSSTYETIASTIAPSPTEDQSPDAVKKREITKDDQGQACTKDSYRDQLNKAARGESSIKQEEETIVSKVPGLSKLQETVSGKESTKSSSENTGNGVTRPDDDVQVEEFLRRQYMSKKDTPRLGSEKS